VRTAFSPVGLLITLLALVAGAAFAVFLPDARDSASAHGGELAALFAITLLLQSCSVRVSARGSISTSSLGVLAAAFLLGAGAAMVIAVAAAAVQWIRRRGLPHRAIFDAANFSLSAGVAATVFEVLAGHGEVRASEIVAATLAGAAYCTINTGLLCCAMGLSEGTRPAAIWRERFQWAMPHYVAAGPVAFAAVLGYQGVGVFGIAIIGGAYAASLVGHRRFALAA
jgi:hypothetical protein